MEELIKAVQGALAGLEAPDGGENAPKLFRYVDLDWGQVDYFDAMAAPVKFPAALVDLVGAEWSDLGDLAQQGRCTVRVRVVELVLGNSSATAPAAMRERAWRTWGLAGAVHTALHGKTPAPAPSGSPEGGGNPPACPLAWGALMRERLEKVNRRDGLREMVVDFSVSVWDVSASPRMVGVAAEPQLTIG